MYWHHFLGKKEGEGAIHNLENCGCVRAHGAGRIAAARARVPEPHRVLGQERVKQIELADVKHLVHAVRFHAVGLQTQCGVNFFILDSIRPRL